MKEFLHAPSSNLAVSKGSVTKLTFVFSEHERFTGEKITEWAPSSHDLNPIESLWSMMKMELYEDGKHCSSKVKVNSNYHVNKINDLLAFIEKSKLVTVVEGDPKAPSSISTTPRCRRGRYSFPWIASLYPCSLPYDVEC